MSAQLHEARSAGRAPFQRMQVSAMEHRFRMYEVFERAAKQWPDLVVEFSVTGCDHVLRDLCKRNKEEDAAGFSSGGCAV